MDKLLNYFMEEPEREFFVRELAKLINKSPTTVSKLLKRYGKESLLRSERKLNHLLFKANTENEAFKDLKLYYNIKRIRESGLVDFLVENYHPKTIVLFGSFRKAENIPGSDIDLLLITANKKKVDLNKYEKILKHKIQLILYSDQEIARLKKKNKELLNNLANGFVLEGYWVLFE